MHTGQVPNGDLLADPRGPFVTDVDHGIILNIATRPDLDRIDVAA